MKHLKFMTALLAAGMIFVACNKDEDETPEQQQVPAKESYVGILSVDQNNGTFYVQEDVIVDCTPSEDHSFVVTFNQVSFSERMPVKLDMDIPNVEYSEADGKITLSGNSIVPLAMGGEFAKYTITNLTGTISGGTLSLSMNCGDYPLTFTGEKQ